MPPEKKLKLFQFNVGAGDHFVLELPNGEYGIIDFHYANNLNFNKPPVVYLLKSLVRLKKKERITIAFICLSHYDKDHLRGITSFFKIINKYNIKVRNVWLGGEKDFSGWVSEKMFAYWRKKIAKTTIGNEELEQDRDAILNTRNKFKKIESFLRENEIENAKYVKSGQQLARNLSGFKVYGLAPMDKHITAFQKKGIEYLTHQLFGGQERSVNPDGNLISSIIVFESDQFRLIFGGDAPREVWEDSIKEHQRNEYDKNNLFCDLIKVSHHGSANSSSLDIWRNLIGDKKETYFAISAGRKYNHPASQTLANIKTVFSEKAPGGGENNKPVFLTTNACFRSLEKLDYQEYTGEDLDIENWKLDAGLKYFKKKAYLKNIVSQTLSPAYTTWIHPRPNEDQDKLKTELNSANTKLGLLAFVIEFDLDNKTIEVYKRRSNLVPPYESCVFEKHKSKPSFCE